MDGNITFFIGNGFDINLGLDTRYKDIFTNWEAKCPSSQNIFLNDFKNASNDNFLWWDFEESIGKLTLNKSDLDKYIADVQDAQKYIRDYLTEEQERYNYKYTYTARSWRYTIKKCIFDESVNYTRGGEGTINFVSFNYTKTLNTMYNRLKKKKVSHFRVYTGKDENGEKGYLRLGKCINIHGSCSKEIIMGVDSDSQIQNDKFRNQKKSSLIVKQDLIENVNKQKLTDIIDTSSLIILFGISVGCTDATYWDLLHAWLKKDKHRKLIFFAHDTSHVRAIIQPTIDIAIENIIGTDKHLKQQIITRIKHGTKGEKEFEFKKATRKKYDNK